MNTIFSADLPLANFIGLIATVIPAAWSDYKKWRIPNVLLLWSALGGLILSLLSPMGIGVMMSLQGALIGFLMFLPLYLIRGMAAGDVKLLATLGLFTGPIFIMGIGLMSLVIGGMWACFILFSNSHTAQIGKIWLQIFLGKKTYLITDYKFKENIYYSSGELIPYGVVIAIGCILMIFINYLNR
jgi:prepilin peptidase CpaA